ncbi:hypothetical protein [Thiomonas sp.]
MQLDSKHKKAIEDILNRRDQVASTNLQIKEDIKTIAEELGVRVAQLNKVIGLVEKERAKGSVLAEEQENLDAAGSMA